MSASCHEELLLTFGAARDRAAAAMETRRLRVALWMATPFFTGAVIMAQELVAFRLYAPYFGYSIYVWGSMISVVMAALAFGYAIGGWIADRSQTDFLLYLTILGSALYQLGTVFAVHGLLRVLAEMGDFSGVPLASLIIFAPPMTAMATTCPFLIRMLAHCGRIGSAAGRIYAVSTIGSIAGTLGTSFLLVPHLGTQKTLEVICIVSLVTAVAGLVPHSRVSSLALGLIVTVLIFAPTRGWPSSTIWAAESPYNLVRVVRSGRWLLLKLNDERGVHTIRNEDGRLTRHYYDEFALGPVLIPAKRLLVLGLGGGGSIASTRMAAPDISVDAVEIDPKVVEAGVRFFGLNPDDGRLHIHVADARPWLARNRNSYELVHIDLYQGGPYIPFYLVTREFFAATRAHMSPDGLLMMNLVDTGRRQELLFSTVATLKQVFPSVEVLLVGRGNFMLLAFVRDTSAASIRARLQSFQGKSTIEGLARQAGSQITELNVPAGTIVFTDDFAPVEEITRCTLKGN